MGAERKFLFQQLFGDKISDLKDYSEEDLQKQLGQINESYFTAGVDILRNNQRFPNGHINELMALFWDLVGNRVTPSVMASFVPSLSFWGEQRGVSQMGMVLVPEDFYFKVLEDPYMQLGALVFNASKARDYYYGKLVDFNAVQQRANAYEAEYLNTVKQLDREFRPNAYQTQVLNAYPEGLASLQSQFKYGSPPFVKPPTGSV